MMTDVVVFVMLDDCLIHVKSGDHKPRNIADVMPDYNLWYAIKYLSPRTIVVVSNTDQTKESWPLRYFETKLKYITLWLSQVALCNSVNYSYSIRGNWLRLLSREGDPGALDLIDGVPLRREEKQLPALFIDSDKMPGLEYIRSTHPGMIYMTASDFIEQYNLNPRKYEKKDP